MKLPAPTRIVVNADGTSEIYMVDGQKLHNVTKVTHGPIKEGSPTTITLEVVGPVLVEEAPKPTAAEPKAVPAKAEAKKAEAP